MAEKREHLSDLTPRPGILELPNYTQTPNLIFQMLPQIKTVGEIHVILVVVRNTWGWHLYNKFIPLSLNDLMRLTGLSKHTVIDGAARACARGLVERVPYDDSYGYRLAFAVSKEMEDEAQRVARLEFAISERAGIEGGSAESALGSGAESAPVSSAGIAQGGSAESARLLNKREKEKNKPLLRAQRDGERGLFSTLNEEQLNRIAVRVVQVWKREMGHPDARVDDSKLRPVMDRLRADGFTFRQMVQAIRGCKASDHHMARDEVSNPKKILYNSIPIIFRNATKTEDFIYRYERWRAEQWARRREQGGATPAAAAPSAGIAPKPDCSFCAGTGTHQGRPCLCTICSYCSNSGMEVIVGKGARRCRCRTAQQNVA
jgi:hypothetical protein